MIANRVVHNSSLAASALLGTITAIPATAATLGVTVSPPDLLLVGSLALLVVALVMRVLKGHSSSDSTPEGEDLRWWKNPQM